MKKISLLLLLFVVSYCAHAQKVGLVLSGGGANAIAHLGVIKTLEQNNIPIDYITGTSMGAIIGGLYAAGYSPDSIIRMMSSEEFIRNVQGEVDERYTYYFKKPAADAAVVQVKFAFKGPITASLPTNIVSPFALDFAMIEVFSGANAVAKNNFDSLFIPFRCVASNVRQKKSVVFRYGELNKAIRASSTYPFYYKPVLTDGELLFDGGLYNNFPVDAMIDDFNPDIIIGSNVSYNYDSPTVDDLFSQLKNMLVSQTDYSLKGKQGVIILPDVKESAFDFTAPYAAFAVGEKACLEQLEAIKSLISKRRDKAEVEQKRSEFNAKKPSLLFNNIHFHNLKTVQENYFKRSLIKKGDSLNFKAIKPRYLRLFEDEQLKYIYPTANFDSTSNKFDLNLFVEKEKDLKVKFGGIFSSKPINTGYIGVKYNFLGQNAYAVEANSYFGKFYSSVQLTARLQTAWKIPLYIETFGALNKWDYFTSRATFFEDNKPSFIIVQNKFAGVELGIPIRFKGKLVSEFKGFEQDCNYYLIDNFSAQDTADLTQFFGYTLASYYERSTLDKKQYASKGTYLKFGIRYINGFERTLPGSTNLAMAINKQYQDWVSFSFKYDNYFKTFRNLSLGIHTQALFNSRYFFSNIKSSIIFSPAFQPIPESKTLFLDNYRANKFATLGLSSVYRIRKNLDYRLEAYLFQAINSLEATPNQKTELSAFLAKRYYIVSTSVILHSPIGPISASLNYYNRPNQPLSFIINFGYLIFNRGLLD